MYLSYLGLWELDGGVKEGGSKREKLVSRMWPGRLRHGMAFGKEGETWRVGH